MKDHSIVKQSKVKAMTYTTHQSCDVQCVIMMADGKAINVCFLRS